MSEAQIAKLRDRAWLERQVAGALASAIDAYGPIERATRASAAKRIVGQIYGGLNEAAAVPGEERPFAKGEFVYIVWPEGTQPEGATCEESRVMEDDGRDGFVLLADLRYVDGSRLRRDRRGRQAPVYAEVPR